MAKVAVGIRVDEELLERLRNAIWHVGQGLTVTSVAEQAMEKAVEALEKRNGGKPYEARRGRIARSPVPHRKNRA